MASMLFDAFVAVWFVLDAALVYLGYLDCSRNQAAILMLIIGATNAAKIIDRSMARG